MSIPSDEFGYLHTSGRFSRPKSAVVIDLDHWEDDPTISLETFTEFSGNHRRQALLGDPAWGLFNGKEVPGADDCVIRWRKAEWRLLETDVSVVSRVKTWRTNGKPIPPQYVTTVLLQHLVTGELVMVDISHLPSHIQVGKRLRNTNRSAKWRDAIRGWRQHSNALRKTWAQEHGKIRGRIRVADWNFDFRVAWFRRYLKKSFPALAPTWVVGSLPRRGTLGRRIIDVALISRALKLVGKVRLLRTTSSDHTAIKMRLKFR